MSPPAGCHRDQHLLALLVGHSASLCSAYKQWRMPSPGAPLRAQIDIDLMAKGGQPALWSAEEPHLYILVLTLLDRQGEHLDTESTQVLS